MTKGVRATGTIEAQTRDFDGLETLEGGELIRMRATDLFHGDIEGEARAAFVATLFGDTSSEFAGIFRFSGSLHGRQGTFLLSATGASDQNRGTRGTWRVLTGSGTRELSGVGQRDLLLPVGRAVILNPRLHLEPRGLPRMSLAGWVSAAIAVMIDPGRLSLGDPSCLGG